MLSVKDAEKKKHRAAAVENTTVTETERVGEVAELKLSMPKKSGRPLLKGMG
ncbi:hypothetical protein [Pantoea ananatis]|uniref:hypothetical protein n=1 Tax=Pantoea ananas TaxID=553 RepID=UPI000B2D76B7|nr:hypothetical protein [Pantoea ananatis]MCW0311512.1 hypothetical protein [Pantoea ananatis]MCW0351183.1 hypothetical protein [Pantoea ananatis]QZE28293.1 hypothetical protein K4732_15425 [Pantoea ananatis]UYL03697.1 hypothetical protein NG830_10345 [Pantoea ananatis]